MIRPHLASKRRPLPPVHFTVPALAVMVAFCWNAAAQTGPRTNILDPEFVRQLINRVGALEEKAKRVDELEAEVKALKTGQPAASEVMPPLREVWPKVQFNLQGDIDFHLSSEHANNSSFLIGDLDPFITARLSENGSVLGDFIIASDQGGFTFEIERVLLQYHINDYLNIEAGRFHSAIGYYPNTFHNGTFFQTMVERPDIYAFEDDGGILPVHGMGISVNGDIPSGSWRLHYVAEVSNGRNYSLDANPLDVEDDNDYKAVNIALSSRPEFLPGLQFGGSVYHDTLTPVGVPRTDQLIFSAYACWRTQNFEWLNEGILMRNAPSGEQAHWTQAAYSQISKKFGKFRPYARIQWRNSPENDPVLASIHNNFSIWEPAIGVRFDFSPMMAFKIEYDHEFPSNESEIDELTAQWTFRF